MTGCDTNIVLRYLLADDVVQSPLVRHWIEDVCARGQPAVINELVAIELYWVLRKKKQVPKADIIASFEALLANPSFRFADEETIIGALDAYAGGPADLADYLVAYRNIRLSVEPTMTFDQDAAKHTAFQLFPASGA